MTDAPAVTNLVQYPAAVTRVVKIDHSVAIIIGDRDLWFCAPFSLNREMGGIHYIKYHHTDTIVHVCGIWLPSDIAIDSVAGRDQRDQREFNLLIYDGNSWFHVLNPARLFVTMKFRIDDIDNVKDMVGNKARMGEFVVLTSSRVKLCEIRSDGGNVARDFDIAAKSVANLNDFYVISVNGDLILLRNMTTSIFTRDQMMDQFVIDQDKAILLRFYSGPGISPKAKITIFDSQSLVINGMKVKGDPSAKLFDAGDGYIVAFIYPYTVIAIDANDTSRRLEMTIPHKAEFPVDSVQSVITAVNKQKQVICIILFSGEYSTMIEVPISILDSHFDEEEEEIEI